MKAIEWTFVKPETLHWKGRPLRSQAVRAIELFTAMRGVEWNWGVSRLPAAYARSDVFWKYCQRAVVMHVLLLASAGTYTACRADRD